MNVLILTPQLPYPPRQGTTLRNYHLIRQLSADHTVDLLTFLAPGERLESDSPLHQYCRQIATAPQPERRLSQRLVDTFFSRLPDMGLRLESGRMFDHVTQFMQERAYDLVQIEGIEMAQYGRHAQQISQKKGPSDGIKTKLIFDDHNCEYLLQKRNAFTDLKQPKRWVAAGYSLVQWQKLCRYEARICTFSDATLAVSEVDQRALQALAPTAGVHVVSNGIDLDEYRPEERGQERQQSGLLDQQGPILVFTGKMDYRPNIDAVLWFGRHVLPLIQEKEPNARFQIVGMNPHSRLDELRQNRGIEITGAVDEIKPYIHGANLYVIPMRVGGGTRFKVLEAMACGKAIVSTRLGVEGIQVEDGQALLLADSPQAFAASVLQLCQDQREGGGLSQGLGHQARQFVEKTYGWGQIMPKLQAVYEQVCHRTVNLT